MDEEQQLNSYLDFSIFYSGFEFEPEYFRREFLEKFEKLPQTIKDFMLSEETSAKLLQIGKTFELVDHQITFVSLLCRYVLAGEIYIKTMPNLMTPAMNIDINTANVIFDRLVKELFAPVWEDIKKIQVQRYGNTKIETPKPSYVPPRAAPAAPKPVQPQPPRPAPAPRPKIPGEDLPETGGNIIDLRKQR